MEKKQIFTEESLRAMGLIKLPNGQYSKAKSVQQPREQVLAKARRMSQATVNLSALHTELFEKDHIDTIEPNEEFRRISLVLLGEPMPKQSVRSTKTGHHFQPKKYLDREKDYRRQIAEQLPKDFNMFTGEVRVTKMVFMHAPLKGFHKIKGMMDRIRSGELIPKLTRGDIDNNFKLIFDSMSGLVFEDDALIWSIDGAKKVFSTGGAVEIELIGK